VYDRFMNPSSLRQVLSASLCFLVLLPSVGVACTVFSFAGNDTVLFGNSEDHDDVPYIWFLEARGNYHAVLCLGFDCGGMQGGMNDAGLCYDAAAGTSHILNWHQELADAPPDWPTLVLQYCETVDEVEAFIRRYDYSSKGMAQFLYLDRNGDSLIVTTTHDGELAFYSRSGGARTITNFNLTDHSVGTYPCWRFDTTSNLLRNLELGTSTPSVDYFRAILNGVHQPGYTAYSNVFDVRSLTAYVYREHNFREVRVIHLVDILEQGAPGCMTLEAYFQRTRGRG